MIADRQKAKENVDGKYYVNGECIGCGLCSAIASDNFRTSLEGDEEAFYNYVFKQPGNELELELCEEARNECPVSAINDDGDKPGGQ